jgi:hypothetical protein
MASAPTIPATFVVADFLTRYQEFAQLNTAQPGILPLYFAEAGLYCRNDGGGPVKDAFTLTTFLWMLTAHIAAMNGGVNGQQPGQGVGRLSSVGEGSVHVSLEMKTPGSAAWFMQTKYGAEYWQASLPYRLGGHYVNPHVQGYGV